jgi:hypothetical protein
MADEIQVGTVGLPIRLTLFTELPSPANPAGEVHDPVGATYLELTLARPRGLPTLKLVEADGVAISTDREGRPCLFYRTKEGDLGQPGAYRLQGFLEDTAGRWPSEVVRFEALANIRTEETP